MVEKKQDKVEFPTKQSKTPPIYTHRIHTHTHTTKNQFWVGNTPEWWQWWSLRSEIIEFYFLYFPNFLWWIHATVIINQQKSPSLRWLLGQSFSNLLTAPTWSSWFPLSLSSLLSLVCTRNFWGMWPQGQSPTDGGWESIDVSTPHPPVGHLAHVLQSTSESPSDSEWEVLVNTLYTGFSPFPVSPSPVLQLCFLGSLPK